jgi:putative hydrolase of HD superfamily
MKPITNFLFELAQLRRIKHEGWRFAGIDNPESVGDHSLRAAQIAYFLAKLEKHEDPYKVVTMVVFHDIGECRVGDIHKIANRYITGVNEEQAVRDQTQDLPNDMSDDIVDMWKQTEEKSSHAGLIAKDSDLLEQALMAKEYISQGHLACQDWIDTVEQRLNTDSAKKLLEELKDADVHEWWQGLKKM